MNNHGGLFQSLSLMLHLILQGYRLGNSLMVLGLMIRL
jgi:hypothetical protein